MEKIRLQKFIADSGLMSRRAAESEIERGNVSVNGHVATLGTKIDPAADVVSYKGKRIRYERRKYTYIMLNKPRGYLSSTADDRGRKCVTDLLDGVDARVYPVGRLDMDSEGLLLLTNDGDFANRLMHPRHEVTKVYQVTVKGYTETALERLKQPVTLDGYTIAPPEVALLHGINAQGNAVLQVTIHEGRNRQVRRMCAIAGLTVVRLVRVAEGTLRLGSLPLGQWRYLTAQEIAEL